MGLSSIQMPFDTYGHLFEQAQNDARANYSRQRA